MMPVARIETYRQDGENERMPLILSTTSAYSLLKPRA